MRRILTTSFFVVAAAALLLAFPNCDSGDDATEDVQTQEDIAEQADVEEGTPVTFTAAVLGFGEGDPAQPKEGVKIEALNNDTGKPLGKSTVSDADGNMSLELTAGKLVGFKMTLDGYKDTFQYDLEPDAKDETLWAVSINIYNLALGVAGLTVDAGNSTLAGAVYFVNDKGEEEAVGCATVTTDPPTDDVRYMATEQPLPTTLEKQSSTSLVRGQFIATNLKPQAEKIKVTAWIGEEELGSVEILSTADSICLANIYVDPDRFDKNPTPDPPLEGCK